MENNYLYNYHSKVFNNLYLDRYNKPVERNPIKFPYSFSFYVVQKRGDIEEITNSIYSDRLLQQSYQKYNSKSQKHFGNTGQKFDDRSFEKIEAFLRDYFNDDNIQLILIEKGCNVSSGYPIWLFSWKTVK